MAYGTDPTKMALEAAQRSPTPPPPPELDRFDECTLKQYFFSTFLFKKKSSSGLGSRRKKTIS